MASNTNKTGLYRSIAIPFIALSVVIVLVIFYVSFSWATVVIVPKSQVFSANYDVAVVDASQGNTQVNAVSGKVIETELEGQGTFNATGTQAESQQAGGMVTFVNTSGKDQPLRATTRVLSANGTLFRTKDFVNVPAKGEVQAPVVADKPGDTGQISDHLSIPGLSLDQQSRIYAQAFTTALPGTATAKIVSEDDISQAQSALEAKLENSFMATLTQGQSTYTDTHVSRVMDRVVTVSQASKKAGDKADTFDVKITVKFSAVTFNDELMNSYLVTRLREKVGPGQDVVPPLAHEIRYVFGSVDPVKKTAVVKVSTTAQKILKQDARIFDRSRLVGLSSDEVKAYFASNEDVQEVKVQLYPFWVFRTPLLEDHINILIKK